MPQVHVLDKSILFAGIRIARLANSWRLSQNMPAPRQQSRFRQATNIEVLCGPMVPKNIQFSLLIPILSRQREFNFLQRGPDLYDVDTTDERGERFYFKLIQERGQWIIAQELLPAWLLDSEALVRQAIIDYEG